MNLTGRERQSQLLRDLVGDAFCGAGNVAVISGAAGMGKSALLTALADEAAALGAVVLAASCSQGEEELPFAVISQLMRCLPDGQDRWNEASLAGGDDALTVAKSVGQVLFDLAEGRPVVLIADDIQFADQASARCLSYLVRRIRPSRMLAVFSQQETTWRPPTWFQAELLRQPRCQLVRLAPFAESDVAAMIRVHLGEEAADRLGSSWHQISGGSPLLLQAMLADHPEPGQAFCLAILSCLHRLSFGLHNLAAGLAVAGDSIAGLSTGELSRLAGVDGELLEAGLRSLSQTGLIAPDRQFRHPLVRLEILASLDPQLRARLHGLAAEVAFKSGLAAEQVAEHLRASWAAGGGSGPRWSWAVPALEQAACAAISGGRIEAAVDYLNLAADACTDDQHRAAIRTTLIRAEWRIDPAIPAVGLSELMADLDQGRVRGNEMVVLAKALLWHGRIEEARSVLLRLGQPAADAHRPAPVGAGAELRALQSWLRCTYPPVLDACPRVPASGFAPPTAAVLHRQEAAAALVTVLTEGPSAPVLPTLQRVLRFSRLEDMSMDAEECALLALVFCGQLESAERWSQTLAFQAVARNAASRHARLAAIQAEIALRQGDLADAARYARLALRLIPLAGWGVAIGAPLSAAVLALTAMGDFDAAAELIRQPVPESMLDTRYGLHYLQARGHYQLAVGNDDAALADFLKAGELMRAWQLDAAVLVSWRLAAAEVLLRTDQKKRALELITDQLNRPWLMSGREHGSALRLLAFTSEVSARPALLRQAAELHQAAGDRYELGRTLAALAVAYHKCADPRRARTARNQALTIAQECQAKPLVGRLSAADQETSRAEPCLLTDTERRVADLAAVGYTNRDISDKLFITISTVEQHLTRIYRKLNLAGRNELSSSPALLHNGITNSLANKVTARS